MTYSVSMDEIVRKKTVGVIIILCVMPLFSLFIRYNPVLVAGVVGFFSLALLWTYLHKPGKYEVTNNRIIVHRLIGNVQFDIKDITRVDRIHHDLLRNSTKGGAFGYLGKYNTELGKTRWYATRRDKLVLITKTDNSKIILTPDNLEAFIEDIEQKKV